MWEMRARECSCHHKRAEKLISWRSRFETREVKRKRQRILKLCNRVGKKGEEYQTHAIWPPVATRGPRGGKKVRSGTTKTTKTPPPPPRDKESRVNYILFKGVPSREHLIILLSLGSSEGRNFLAMSWKAKYHLVYLLPKKGGRRSGEGH